MQLIVITSPTFTVGEASIISQILALGIDKVHIRKPNATADECRQLIEGIPAHLHSRLVLHDHFELTTQFPSIGVHLNHRNSTPPTDFKGSISKSCHSLDEVERAKPMCHYVFLSPIFDSISKQGYASAFLPDVLIAAQKQGIIDRKVYALGGISASNIPQIRNYGFGGAALLGDIWQRVGDSNFTAYITSLVQEAHKH